MKEFKGQHFQGDNIGWYCKYGISYREGQETLAQGNMNVDHSTISRWAQRYAPEMDKRPRW